MSRTLRRMHCHTRALVLELCQTRSKMIQFKLVSENLQASEIALGKRYYR